ncbi:hypothetical protein [Nonomuraea composti]|uniref:hypothetical protein n=1 Tax=Nonomuraea composti TaxID=2720023 RepID=UPI00197E3B96|nr:hypothetical protein [Nonomuraea sp. FMUSA5-5]
MADVIVDPEVPPESAHLLRESRGVLLKMRQGWTPASRRPLTRGHVLMLAAFGPAALIGLLLSRDSTSLGSTLMLLAVPTAGLIIGLVIAALTGRLSLPKDEDDEFEQERELFAQLRWYEGHYVLVEDLDPSARRLLTRAQRAIITVTASRVNTEGLLDDVRNAVMLPAQEWEITRLLAKLSSVRVAHRATISQGLTPEAEAAVLPLTRALDLSQEAVLARVEALERYAAHVSEAERAYQARLQVEELRGRLPQYEELVAETEADAFAVRELQRLTMDASQLEEALRRSVSSAQAVSDHSDPEPSALTTERSGWSGTRA